MKSKNRDFLNNKLKDICFSTLRSYSFNKVEKNLSEVESTALKNLNECKDLVIQKADKGNTVVITDHTKYLEGKKSFLSDSSKFMQLLIDEGKCLNYIINLESKLKDHFKVLKNEEKNSEKEFDSIYPVGTTAGILDGNPKVHKTVVNNTPKFQPILSAINTPTYLLAKYLNPILSPLMTNEFTVKNSFDFAEEVVNYDHNLYMASLDVESLFTNIPLEETIKNCVNNLFSNNFYSGKLSRKDLYDLLKLGTTESSFIFHNKLYKQIDRVAMGSPLCPTLANAFLCHYEKIWLNECPSQFKPVVYRCYVDDIFVLFKSKEHLKLFVNYMNSKHKNIKFTFETEDSNHFSFLDVKITCKNKQFVTLIFRKVTFSGVLINYNSFIFDTYKIGLVYTLLFWFFKFCSSMENFHIEVKHLRSIFKCNNYPVNIIDQCIKKFLDNFYVSKQIVPTVPKKELLVVLPFLATFSLNLRKHLYKSVSKSLPECNINVIFQSKNQLSSLFKFKDSIPLYLRSHLIYKF